MFAPVRPSVCMELYFLLQEVQIIPLPSHPFNSLQLIFPIFTIPFFYLAPLKKIKIKNQVTVESPEVLQQ